MILRSDSRGFTFLEILVVVILISLSASLVATHVGRSTGDNRTVFFVKKVRAMCLKARQQAMITGYPHAFMISGSRRICWIKPENPVDIPAAVTIEGEHVTSLDSDTYMIQFFPDGSATGGILFFKVDEITVFRIRVNVLTGIIEMIHDNTSA